MSGRDKTGRFVKGCKPGPGNPNVRRIAEHTRAIRDAVTADELRAVVRKLADQALAGDIQAARVLLDRCAGTPRPEREEPIPIPLPTIESAADLVPAFAAIFEALNAGTITVDEASKLAGMIEGSGDAFERRDLELRIKALEERGPPPPVKLPQVADSQGVVDALAIVNDRLGDGVIDIDQARKLVAMLKDQGDLLELRQIQAEMRDLRQVIATERPGAFGKHESRDDAFESAAVDLLSRLSIAGLSGTVAKPADDAPPDEHEAYAARMRAIGEIVASRRTTDRDRP